MRFRRVYSEFPQRLAVSYRRKNLNDLIQKGESKGFLAKLGDTILSVFGCKSVDVESLKALKNLINERINQLMFTT